MRARFILLVAAILAAGCSSSTPKATPPSPTASTMLTRVASATPWVCRPDQLPNPCTNDLGATVATKAGTSRAVVAAASNPPADCFCVYQTVSQAPADNAPRATAPEIESTAHAQVGLFSSVCRVFVPAYRQITLRALAGGHYTDPKIQAIAYADVRDAWRDYLAHENGDRPVVLIGHSQGAMLLTRLIASEIDRAPAVRGRLLSAILLGGNVTVKTGRDVGGSFQALPACRRPGQVGCVIAYSSFASPPPRGAYFGRTTNPGQQVLCTDPTALAGHPGSAHPYVPADRVTAGPAALPGTGFVAYPGQLRVTCRTAGGASWLQVTTLPGAALPAFGDALGPLWGLHVADVTLALGDLVEAVRRQEAAHPNG